MNGANSAGLKVLFGEPVSESCDTCDLRFTPDCMRCRDPKTQPLFGRSHIIGAFKAIGADDPAFIRKYMKALEGK